MSAVPTPADERTARSDGAKIQVELFGVPRVLARQEVVAVRGATLAELGQSLRDACPALVGTVLHAASGWPLDGYIFVVDERFTRDPSTPMTANSTVLLVSSAAGG